MLRFSVCCSWRESWSFKKYNFIIFVHLDIFCFRNSNRSCRSTWCCCFIAGFTLLTRCCCTLFLWLWRLVLRLPVEIFFPFFGAVVLSDGLLHISSSPLVTGQGILQSKRTFSGPSDPFTHSCAAQLQSYFMHDFAQIFLSFIQTLHLCENKKKIRSVSVLKSWIF